MFKVGQSYRFRIIDRSVEMERDVYHIAGEVTEIEGSLLKLKIGHIDPTTGAALINRKPEEMILSTSSSDFFGAWPMSDSN